MNKTNKQGFTLIELLIVLAIISIISAVVFVALDPLTRFRDSRDAARWTDISAVVSAIKINQVDNGGDYMTAVKSMGTGVYMIVDGAAPADCTTGNAYCDVDVTSPASCVDLSSLVTQGYLGKVPVSPNGKGTWDSKLTGYTLEKSSTGIITVRACEAENAPEIKVSR